MKVTFLGAAREVTGSCTLIETGKKRILIDCGLEQGGDTYENAPMPVAANQIDFMLLTHAHIDHSGKIPMLYKNGFKGKIYATRATMELCDIMLLDSAYIQQQEAVWRNRRAKRSGGDEYVPLYTVEDASNVMKQFVPCSYGRAYEVDGIKFEFFDAGHLLGSSSIRITDETGESILFSGDIGNIDRPLIRDPEKSREADYIVIESTYGDRLHGKRPDYVGQLSRIIQSTLDKGGNLVIPSFAVGRTQEMLYLIRIIKERGLVKGHDGFPVYVDSPLAAQATSVYAMDMEEFYDDEARALLDKGINPLVFDGLKISVTSDESKLINYDSEPKVIISSSGMCEAGRIRHHLKYNLWREECCVLFVGYQAAGTLGNAILSGCDSVKLFGEPIAVKARIENIDGISGHADRDMLLSWLSTGVKKAKRVFVNHGEENVSVYFAGRIQELYGVEAEAPYNGAEYDLTDNVCLYKGNTQHIDKAKVKKVNTVYMRLLDALARLKGVCEKMQHCANHDIGKLADQIISLCEKWEKK